MSKYIDLEDAIEAIEDKIADYIPTLYGRYREIPLELRVALERLPTIEVSEDCISREYLEEEYWQTLIPIEMINTDVELGINIGIDKMHDVIKNAPSVTTEPQTYITEDRDTQILDAWQVHHRNTTTVEHAPSVVPSRAEGEWKRHPIHDNRAWDVCTACGTGCRRRHYGFNEDGTEWVEQANYPFCPNCGAKMKG